MSLPKVLLAGFRGHGPRWLRFHGSLIDIVAIAGTISPRVKEAMAEHQWRGRTYEDPAEMLRREAADLAFLWTPRTDQHVPLARLALDRGLHVMLEKPLTDDPAEARDFAAAVRQSGRRVMVMQDIRWQNAALELKNAWDQPAVGPVHLLDLSMRGEFGAFTYEGIHLVDLARFLFGREARWVFAAAPPVAAQAADDNMLSLHIGFDGGGVARIVTDWCCHGHQHWIQARAEGPLGAMSVVWGQPIQLQLFDQLSVQALPQMTEEPNSMKRLLLHFLQCIQESREPANSIPDQLKNLDILFAARQSARSGQVVPLPYQLG